MQKMAGAIKISRIPYGFFEKEMWKYFSQFGRVQRLKLFRSKKTGNSKGFAFIQFAHEGVAKIAAETMNNYLMFDKLLKCEFIPKSKIMPSMFKSWRQEMKPKLGETTHKRRVNSEKNEYQDARTRCRLYTKLVRRNQECRRLGINYQFEIPPDPRGKPVLRRSPVKYECEVESEGSRVAQPRKTRNTKVVNDTLLSQPSLYSLVIDSSDDEIELKTPPQTVKRRKRSKEEDMPSIGTGPLGEFSIKDEPLTSGDEDEASAMQKANETAGFIKLSAPKRESKEPISKKAKKLKKKAEGGKVNKVRRMKRYFTT